MGRAKVKPAELMNQEIFLRHMESRHSEQMPLEMQVEPGRTKRRLHAGRTWLVYHAALHRLGMHDGAHFHRKAEPDG